MSFKNRLKNKKVNNLAWTVALSMFFMIAVFSINQYEQKIKRLNSEIDELNEQEKNKRESIIELESEIETNLKDMSKDKKEIEKLEEEVKSNKKKVNSLEKSNEKLNNKVKELESKSKNNTNTNNENNDKSSNVGTSESNKKSNKSENEDENTVNNNNGRTIVMEATAYTDNANSQGQWVGQTATGMTPQRGIIAVDPSVIPLGTKVYVEGYGDAIAGDTGGAIKGNIIDVFVDTESEANEWGRKQVEVTILE